MRHDELYVAVGAVCPGEGSRPLLGGRNKHHRPFGIRISMISNGPWCYGPSLPPGVVAGLPPVRVSVRCLP
jgi:hypothetical protein